MTGFPPWRLPDVAIGHRYARSETWLLDRVRRAPATIAAALETQGLLPLPASALDAGLVTAAQEIVDRRPDLGMMLQGLVSDLHPLHAEPGYDVSHSEPRWSDRIFVSVPDRTDAVGALRLAEGVIHESMHLALTLQEEATSLVADRHGLLSSPWRDEERPHQGVMHGFFVFACLLTFFEEIAEAETGETRTHARLRIRDIRAELQQVDLAALHRGLTPAGCNLLSTWSETL